MQLALAGRARSWDGEASSYRLDRPQLTISKITGPLALPFCLVPCSRLQLHVPDLLRMPMIAKPRRSQNSSDLPTVVNSLVVTSPCRQLVCNFCCA